MIVGAAEDPTILITGVAGFIGSTLAERLVRGGRSVVGIDCFTDNYARGLKEKNLEWLRRQPGFVFQEVDLVTADLGSFERLLPPAAAGRPLIVYHHAGLPSVRAGWGEDFEPFARGNIYATRRLLDWAKDKNIDKFVFASTSAVYGDTQKLPMREEDSIKPVSPYGLTKFTAELFCHIYSANFRLPVVILRYFTVYGPRQRPDMGFHKFISAIVEGRELEVYGDGTQTRDFAYIDDVVEATIAASGAPSGEVFNVGGGERWVLNDVIQLIGRLAGKPAKIRYRPVERGDPRDTFADFSRAETMLGYRPKTSVEQGLRNQIAWQKNSEAAAGCA